MKKIVLTVFVFSLLLNFAFSAPVSLSNNQVVASITISGKTETITRDELNNKVAEYRASGTNTQRSEVLDIMINDKVFLMSAERDNVRVSDAEVEERLKQMKSQLETTYGSSISDDDFTRYIERSSLMSFADYKKSLKESLLVEKYVRSKRAADLDKVQVVNDAEIKQFYRKNQTQFVNPEFVRVSHIFMAGSADKKEDEKIKNKLDSVLKDILNYNISFEKAVMEYSEDTGSRNKGGDLGNISASFSQALGDEFIDTAFDLEVGMVANKIVKSPRGYHIIKVTYHEAQKFLALDDVISPDSATTVREYIRAGLEQQKETDNYTNVVNSFVEDLKKSARITINDK